MDGVCVFKAVRLEKNVLKHVHCLAGVMQCRISCTARGAGFGSSGCGSAEHHQKLIKVPRFYKSSSDLLLRCDKPQNLPLWRWGQICSVHQL